MSRRSFVLDDLLGVSRSCSGLDPVDPADIVDGRLAHERRAALLVHARTCSACAELLDDSALFQALLDRRAALPGERRAFAAVDGAARRRLGLRRARGRLGGILWLVPGIAASLVLGLWLLPTHERLIESVEQVPLVPPPAVRGASLDRAWRDAERAWTGGDLLAAEAALREAARTAPDDPDVLFYLGLAQLRLGRPVAAVETLERADRLQGDAPSEIVRWVLAAALERAGRWDDACAALRSVAQLGGGRAADARSAVERGCSDPSAP